MLRHFFFFNFNWRLITLQYCGGVKTFLKKLHLHFFTKDPTWLNQSVIDKERPLGNKSCNSCPLVFSGIHQILSALRSMTCHVSLYHTLSVVVIKGGTTGSWKQERGLGPVLLNSFLLFLFYIGVYLIYNVVLGSGIQHSDSVIFIHVSILFQTLFPFKLL